MGNIDALRDWGHAKDYVRMQWMMLQQDQPEVFEIAIGKQYSVRQFIEWSASEQGMQLRWEGIGVNEVGYLEFGVLNLESARPISSALTPATSALPKSKPFSATRPRPRLNSDGCPKSPHKKCAKKWAPTTWPKPSNTRCLSSMGTA